MGLSFTRYRRRGGGGVEGSGAPTLGRFWRPLVGVVPTWGFALAEVGAVGPAAFPVTFLSTVLFTAFF